MQFSSVSQAEHSGHPSRTSRLGVGGRGGMHVFVLCSKALTLDLDLPLGGGALCLLSLGGLETLLLVLG